MKKCLKVPKFVNEKWKSAEKTVVNVTLKREELKATFFTGRLTNLMNKTNKPLALKLHKVGNNCFKFLNYSLTTSEKKLTKRLNLTEQWH